MPSKNRWKYFSYSGDPKIRGVSKLVVGIADKIRGLAGIKMVVTSGKRPPKTGSAHEKGLAMDVRSRSWRSHSRFVRAMVYTGIKRMGVYVQAFKCPHCKKKITEVKLKPSHVHFDKDETKSQDVFWIGVSR